MKSKKHFAWILTCVFVCTLSLGVAACEIPDGYSSSSNQGPIEGLIYTLNTDGTEYAVDGIGYYTDSDIVIPSTYNDLPVTSINDGAFAHDGLTSIIIPDSVTSIGDYAFYYCYNLTSIEIPDSVVSIGDYAFYHCSSLTSIEIPDSVTNIGSNAFYGCSSLQYNEKGGLKYLGNKSNPYICLMDTQTTDVTMATIDSHCKFIHYSALSYCENLTSIVIPDGVTSIDDNAFESCKSLTNATIGNGVTSIGRSSFYDCSSLTSVVIGDSVTHIGERAFMDCSSLTSITIPDGVTSIDSGTFSGCSSLTNITIPDGVTSIGEYAFGWCNSLTSVTIGDGVTSIDENAFSSCCKLCEVINKSNLNFQKESSDYGYIAYYAMYIQNGGNSNIDKQNEYLFITYENTNYLLGYTGKDADLILPQSYNGEKYEIYKYAFYKCSNLTSIEIPDGATSIGYASFANCDNLTSVTIGNGVTSIGKEIFFDCGKLTNVVIGNGVTSIGTNVFFWCSNLTNITFNGTMEQWKLLTTGKQWNNGIAATKVKCSDGDVTLS